MKASIKQFSPLAVRPRSPNTGAVAMAVNIDLENFLNILKVQTRSLHSEDTSCAMTKPLSWQAKLAQSSTPNFSRTIFFYALTAIALHIRVYKTNQLFIELNLI
jgi:hypothetical protein